MDEVFAYYDAQQKEALAQGKWFWRSDDYQTPLKQLRYPGTFFNGPISAWNLLFGGAWVIIAGCGLAVAFYPEWFGLGDVVETTAERDANLRLTLYVAGQQLARYRKERGVYPDRLADAGRFTPGLVYVKTPDGGYTLKLSRGSERVTLTSSDSLSDFLSPSLSRLVQRKGK